MGLVNCFDSYLQDKKVIAGYTWVYDHIDELDLISFSNEEKLSKMKTLLILVWLFSMFCVLKVMSFTIIEDMPEE